MGNDAGSQGRLVAGRCGRVVELAERRNPTQRIVIALRSLDRSGQDIKRSASRLAQATTVLDDRVHQLQTHERELGMIASRIGRQAEIAMSIADMAEETRLAILAGDDARCLALQDRLQAMLALRRASVST